MDILVITPTLGCRNSLSKTINSVKTIGENRVFHVIITPQDNFVKLQNLFPSNMVICEPDTCRGIYDALNYAINLFKGQFKYITYINDDDYWLPEFSKLFHYLDSNPLVDIVYAKVKYVDSDNRIIGEQSSFPCANSFVDLLHNDIVIFTQQATLMKSKVFFELGGFDENYKLISDSIFWYRAIINKYNFHYQNIFCASYMIHEGQLSADKIKQKVEKEVFLKSVCVNKFNSFYKTIIFRLFNLDVYFKRKFFKILGIWK